MRLLLLTLLLSTLSLAAENPASPAGFNHPGVLVNRGQLDLIRQRVAEGAEPQKTAFAQLLASPIAALDYQPTPRASVDCGSYWRPDLGCKDERRDCTAAYSQALAWYITGNQAYARNAIGIMNAWAAT